jgi:hypothetical protein
MGVPVEPELSKGSALPWLAGKRSALSASKPSWTVRRSMIGRLRQLSSLSGARGSKPMRSNSER